MNLIDLRSRRGSPYLIFIVLSAIFFTASSVFAYQIEFDPIPQLKGIQQWLRGETSLLNCLVTANPKDISQNLQTWIVWHAPGVSMAFLPLTAMGLPLGVAARTTAYILFVVGGIGSIKVVDALGSDLRAKIIVSCLLSVYYLEIGCAFIFYAGDVIPWAVLPWLLLYTIYFCWQLDFRSKPFNHLLVHSSLLGLLLGGVYWLKYSGFLVSLGAATYIGIDLLFFKRNYPWRKRLILLGVVALCTLLPVVLLTALHRSLTGVNSAIEQFEAAIQSPSPYTRGFRLLVAFLAAPGLGLFNSEIFAENRLLMYASLIIKNLLGLDISQKAEIFKTIVGLGGTLVIAGFCLYCAKNIWDKKALTFWCCIAVIPFLLIAYISQRTGINLLIFGIGRYSSGVLIITVFYIVSSYLHLMPNPQASKISKVLASLALMFFLLMPPLSALADAATAANLRKDYVSGDNFLYIPLLSKHDVKSVVDRINSVVTSPKDVVIFVKDEGEMRFSWWLEIKSRFLPLNEKVAGQDTNSKITTSQDLRAILVFAKSIARDEKRRLRIQQKFIQATKWTQLQDDRNAEVAIWFADLKAVK